MLPVVVGVVVALIGFFLLRARKPVEAVQAAGEPPEAIQREGTHLRGGARHRAAAAAVVAAGGDEAQGADPVAGGDEDASSSSDEDEDGDEAGPVAAQPARRGPGKQKGVKRLAREQAKRQRREYHEHMQRERAAREAEREERDVADQVERELQAEREAEEAERARVAKEKADEAEYRKWAHLMSVDEAGDAASRADDDPGNLLEAFVTYIKEHKIVVLDDLAAHFGLKPSEAVARVQALEKMGRITGVIDDRGKFIHITEPELHAVAEHIEREGRISISDLAAASNRLIDLQSSAKDTP